MAWLKGGRPERFAAGVFVMSYLVSWLAVPLRIGEHHVGDAMIDAVLTVIFGALALKGDRWWPFAMTAIMVLTLMVHLSLFLAPELTARDDISARIGLGVLMVSTLLLGVFERWLSGEKPAGENARWKPYQRST